MSDPLNVNNAKSMWTRYAEGTSGRDPLKFFNKAIEVSDGGDGSGPVVVDLGSGAGNETLGFLERGWAVHAVDGDQGAMDVLLSRVPVDQRSRLSTEVASFHNATLRPADLVFASLSLPFAGEYLEPSMANALAAIRPGGWFVGVLFGHNDTWATDDDVAPVDHETIAEFFDGFDPIEIDEEEFDGPSGSGPKHWHWYVVSARRPDSQPDFNEASGGEEP